MAKIGSYRIRWGNVSYGNGRRVTRERMCIAERRYWFGWFPMMESDWRWDEDAAHADIERDRMLRAPLPEPRIVG
jgi:hypothetical protein